MYAEISTQLHSLTHEASTRSCRWMSVHSDSFLGTSQNLEILRQSPQDWVTVTERSVCQQTFQLWKEVEEEWPAWGNVCLSKTDNISTCTYLHQVLSILVKARLHISRLHVKQDFDIRIKIYVHVSRYIKYMKSNKYWSSSSYTDRQSYIISKFAYRHQDSHFYIKIYIEIVIGLYEVLSEKWLLSTILP